MRISEETKSKQGRGKGHGGEYKPWILTREIKSIGTSANVIDWKHGRTVHLLSQAEEWWYYYLRWDDKVTDIREQFPLELEETVKIAEDLKLSHPNNRHTHMTTDMLVDYEDGTMAAYSVKYNRKSVDYRLCTKEADIKNAKRSAEKLMIEKMYWYDKGVKWKLVYKEDLNPVFVNNIRRVVIYYDRNRVHDKVSLIKHLIATKKIAVDMGREIDYLAILDQLDTEEIQWLLN